MNAKQTLAAVFAIASCIPAFSASTNQTTGNRTGASARVPHMSVIGPALGILGRDSEVARECLHSLTSPVTEFDFSIPDLGLMHDAPVIVSSVGETASAQLNADMSRQTGEIIVCLEAIALHAEEIQATIRSAKPDRVHAIQIVGAAFAKKLDADYKTFKDASPGAFGVQTLVADGNNGFSQYSLIYKKPGTSPNNFNTVDLKGNVFHAINGHPAREAITKGVFSFYTNPARIQTLCAIPTPPTAKAAKIKGVDKAPAGDGAAPSFYPCAATYVVKFNGTELEVRKDGQRWFDNEYLGGVAYAIEISGEKGSSTNTQVQTKGGW